MNATPKRAGIAVGAVVLAGLFVWAGIEGANREQQTGLIVADAVTEGSNVVAEPAETVAPKLGGTVDRPVAPIINERGHIAKELGEVGGFYFEEDDPQSGLVVEFSVDKIELAECTEDYAEGPQNGHFVVATVTATVAPGFTEWSGGYPGMPFDPSSFGLIDAEGVTVNDPASASTWGCLADSELIGFEVTEGTTATGKVVLDSPTEHGVLTYRPGLANGGWEWVF